jgi:dephospho-CoA kinase
VTLRVGLTGGIASGKTAAARAFANLGVPVVDADEAARAVTPPGSTAVGEIAALRPNEPLLKNGALDRRKLRELMFRDTGLRGDIERLLHPRIIEKMQADIAALEADYLIVAIPLLAEAGPGNLVDRVLVVDCPATMQIERLMRRDGESKAGAQRILAAQAGRAKRRALADDVIDNSGSMEDLDAQVSALDAHYRALNDGV